MLSINQELFAIEDAIDEVVQAFLQLKEVTEYQQKRQLFLADEELQSKMNAFQQLKESYEEQKDYVAFRPEVKQLRRQLFQQKRQLDLNNKMIDLRQSEVAVQEILAALSEQLSQAISMDIFVDTGLPLAPHKPHHDKGRGNNIKEKETYV